MTRRVLRFLTSLLLDGAVWLYLKFIGTGEWASDEGPDDGEEDGTK